MVSSSSVSWHFGHGLSAQQRASNKGDDEKMEENLVGGRKLGWISEWVKAAKAMSLPMYD